MLNPSKTWSAIQNCSINKTFLFTQLLSLYVVCCLLYPLLLVFDPYHLLSKFRISRLTSQRRLNMAQRELNLAFELPEFDVTTNTSSLLYFWFTFCFFLSFFPVLSILALLVFFPTQIYLLKKFFVKR